MATCDPLGQRVREVAKRFGRAGALGIVVIDASPLISIEQTYGVEATSRCLHGLAELVRRSAGERLRPDDLMLAGETGRKELLVILFRERGNGDFYHRELPALREAIGEGLSGRGSRVFYPYARDVPALTLGTAAVLRNPLLIPDTQVRQVLEEARSDADLSHRIAQRDAKRQLMDVVLGEKIYAVYEPIVDTATMTVFGYEALSRGPRGTPLASPLALFKTAEESGLIYDLDCLCRRQALAGAVDRPPGTKLFLNIRPSAFHDASFQPEAICETLAACNLRPDEVVFEISEQESISNFESFRRRRDDYATLGFEFALDDTGAGYASFEAVLELAPEFVKVDRAFVAGIDEDPARQAILHGFQSIAEKINARIIGEGLDTLEEFQTLHQLGVHFGQGWLFGKPTPLSPEKKRESPA